MLDMLHHSRHSGKHCSALILFINFKTATFRSDPATSGLNKSFSNPKGSLDLFRFSCLTFELRKTSLGLLDHADAKAQDVFMHVFVWWVGRVEDVSKDNAAVETSYRFQDACHALHPA